MAKALSPDRFALVRFSPGQCREQGLWLRWSSTNGVFWRTKHDSWDFVGALDTQITPNLYTPDGGRTYKCTHTAYVQNVEDLAALLRLLGLKQDSHEWGGIYD